MDEAKIVEQYFELRSCRAVAEMYGVSDETIRRILKRQQVNLTGWKRPKHEEPKRRNYRNNPLTEREKIEIVDAYKRLNNQELVAHETCHSMATIHKVLKSYGLARGIGGNQDKQRKITDQQILDAVKTMTRVEIADKFGIHIATLDRRMHKLKVSALPSERHNGTRRGWKSNCWHFIRSQWLMVSEKHPDFEYLETRNKRIRLKCKKCGGVIERETSTVREKTIKCEWCKEAQDLQDARLATITVFKNILNAKTPKTCKTCGGVFYSPYPNALYCSQACKNKKKRKNSTYRARCRKYGVYYDASVTREAVAKRDGYICQICGKPTDSGDRKWGTLGPLFPTVDHIIALANGGTHTWDNVQCAHAICNSYKRDLSEDEAKEALTWQN